jgi:DNA-binding CsgD family transcriptional regulator/tetratricopeptide (TPR) repeat protein
MLLDRWSESTDLCKRAIDMARDVGARQVEGHALNTYGLDLAVASRCDEGIAALEAALAIAREVANADDIGRAYNNLAEAKQICGDTRGALEVVHEGVRTSDEIGLSLTYGTFIGSNGIAYAFALGEWREADALAEARIATQPVSRPQRRYGLSRWVQLLVAEGDVRAGSCLDELRMLLDGFPVEAQFHAPYRIAAAEAALWRSEPDAALATVQAGLDELKRAEWSRFRLRLFRVGMRAAADMAEIERARRNGEGERSAIVVGTALRDRMQRVLDDIVAREGQASAGETSAEVATLEAEQARLERRPSTELWRTAGQRWLATADPYLQAYCRWREAEALLGDGERGQAAVALTEARRVAADLGAGPLLAGVEALAIRSRLDLTVAAPPAPPVAAPDANPFGLTRRERDVLPLLVRGRTNRQIADELFISENTAGVHVSNILGKLGASTRTEAAGIAARLGLGIDP